MSVKRASVAFGLLLALSILVLFVSCGGGGGGGSDAESESADSTYAISGTITADGAPLQGVTVTISGLGSRSVTTDASGNYAFSGLPNRTYSFTPSMTGYSFTPASTSQTVCGANITSVNFTGAKLATNLWIADGGGRLGTVDITTGTVKIVGSMGVTMTDIAFDPDGNLYGITFTSLYRIDKNTAAATLVGNLGISGANSLSFDSAGTLYTATNKLYTVNTSTGAATLIGSGGTPYTSQGDLAFVGGHLYLAAGSSLVELDPSTGSGTLVGSIGFSNVMAMTADGNGNLFGVSGTEVIAIDPATGNAAGIGDYASSGLQAAWGAAYMNAFTGGSLRFPVDGSGWTFISGSIYHVIGGGYLHADDSYAFDMNLPGNLDKGKPVYPVCPGEVIISNPHWGYVLIRHDKPLMLDDGTVLCPWYSGYMHMSGIVGLGSVDCKKQLGSICGWGWDDKNKVYSPEAFPDHLHFVIYTGTPVEKGLVSIDVANQLSMLSRNISSWINGCGTSTLPGVKDPWWGIGEYPCD